MRGLLRARRARRAELRVAALGKFPARSPLASLGQHLALDVGEEHIYWARSRRSREGLRLLEWGRVDLDGRSSEDVLREIARMPWVKTTRVEVPIRSPEIRHRRLSLPALTASQAYKVGRRRATEFLNEQNEPCVGSFMRIRRKGPYPIWLVAIPATAPQIFERRWHALGFEVHRLSSETLALGNLARILPPNPPGQLTAIFDLRRDSGDCVVCDDQGWLFNRVIGVRAARGRSPTEGPVSRIANDADVESPQFDVGAMERMRTELQRTIQYVGRELQLGTVTRIALSGDLPGLDALAAALRPGLEGTVAPIGELIEAGPAHALDSMAARAVGLAMAPDRRGCSLLQPETKLRQSIGRARSQLRVAFCALLAIALAGTFTSCVRIYGSKRAVASMSNEMGSNERRLEIIAETARQRSRARALHEAEQVLRRPEPPWQALLHTLAARAPADVALEELHVGRQEEGDGWQASMLLEARGTSVAEAAQQVTRMGEQLRAAPFLAPAVAAPESSRTNIQEEGRARVFFRLRADLARLSRDSAPQDTSGEEEAP